MLAILLVCAIAMPVGAQMTFQVSAPVHGLVLEHDSPNGTDLAAGGAVTITYSLSNEGNETLDLNLTASASTAPDGSQALDVALNTTRVELPPGARGQVALNVTARAEANASAYHVILTVRREGVDQVATNATTVRIGCERCDPAGAAPPGSGSNSTITFGPGSGMVIRDVGGLTPSPAVTPRPSAAPPEDFDPYEETPAPAAALGVGALAAAAMAARAGARERGRR